MKKMTFLKPFDFIAFGLAVIIFLSSVFINFNGNSENLFLKIKSKKGEYIYTMDQNRKISIDGPIGKTHIIIENQKTLIKKRKNQ